MSLPGPRRGLLGRPGGGVAPPRGPGAQRTVWLRADSTAAGAASAALP
ncbi:MULTISPECIES: hypothetical protein [unclassified Streptomyces]|nr:MULTISPECIES: hypothetical protein [unclassified Streptomyces]MCH0564176.1 hypothetical protein [Streptomyces sp. MUM 2J]MCH0568479.1 hypothetical protein [Streptomyces sp. MUM 136J]